MDIRGFYLQENCLYNVFDQNGNILSENITYLGATEHGRLRFRLLSGNIILRNNNANVFYDFVRSNKREPGVEGAGKSYKKRSKRHYKKISSRTKRRRHKTRSRK